ncbi:MAG: hypothetical protein AAGI37_18225, partial [Planctomycetota bacterium]
MIRFALALLVGGAILTFYGFNQHKLASVAQAEPQSITAADLAANGPGDNAHVTITDTFILDGFSYSSREDKPTVYEEVWIPAISMQDDYVIKRDELIAEAQERNPGNPDYSAAEKLAYPSDIRLVIHSKELKSDREIEKFIYETEVTGLVMNEIEKLEGEELAYLKEMFPSLDTDTVYLIDHNRKPRGTGTTMLMMVGGVLLMLAGPGLFVLGRGS